MKRCGIIAAARKYLGVPYHHQGRVRPDPSTGNKGGLDCLGLVLVVGWDTGHKFPDFTDYELQVEDGRLERGLNQHLARVHKPNLGCVMLMRLMKSAQHVAIRTDRGIIHSVMRGDRTGEVVETTFDDRWKSRVVAYYDFPAVREYEMLGDFDPEAAKAAVTQGGCGCADGHKFLR